MIAKKETPLSVSAALATVSAPTLPSELQSAVDEMDAATLQGRVMPTDRAWQTIRNALLTMQRERERDQWKSRANIAAGIIKTATEQLAASERTCAELRGDLDELRRCFDMALAEWDIEYDSRTTLQERMRDMRTRAEAAERTVEGYKSALSEAKERWFAGVQIETLPDWIELRATELARLKGEGGE